VDVVALDKPPQGKRRRGVVSVVGVDHEARGRPYGLADR
jgi:hypothetical protein